MRKDEVPSSRIGGSEDAFFAAGELPDTPAGAASATTTSSLLASLATSANISRMTASSVAE